MSTTYEIQDNKDPSVVKMVHRNHLVGYYPNEYSILVMIEENVPPNELHDGLFQQCLEQCIGKINNSAEPTAEASIPSPIEP